MNQPCDLIKDLLPLYAEDMVSPYTASLVEEHLAHCPGCQKELSLIKHPMAVAASRDAAPSRRAAAPAPKDTAPLGKLKKMLLLKKIQAIVLTAALALAAALAVFSYLTAPIYFPYSEDLLTVTSTEDAVTVAFDESVTGYFCEEVREPEGAATYFLSAWTTRLDRFLDRSGTGDLALPKEAATRISFTQNGTGSEGDIVIYGDQSNSFGTVTLPRLALSYYMQLACILFLLLAVALLIFWRRRSARLWILRLLLLPASYILGHLCVKGFSGYSYHMTRDLCFIAGVALLLYLALLFGLDLLRRR